MDRTTFDILTDRPVAYHPILAKACGGATVGLFLSQLLYWTGRGKLADGWFWKSASELENETGLTRNEQETARKKLKAIGVLEEKLAGVPATLHFRINFDALETALQFGENSKSSLAKSDKLDSGFSPNLIGEKHQTIQRLPETTTENTQYETSKNEVSPPQQAALNITLSDSDTTEATLDEDIMLFNAINTSRKANNLRAVRPRFDTVQQKAKWRTVTTTARRLYNGRHPEVIAEWVTAAMEKGIRDKAGIIAYTAKCAENNADKRETPLKVQ